MHVDGLDDALEQGVVGGAAGGDGLLGGLDGANGAAELLLTVLQRAALHLEGVLRFHGGAFQDRADFLERKSEKFERHNLFEDFEIALAVDTVAGMGARRLQQAEPVVVVQGFNGYAGQFGEFADVIARIQSALLYRVGSDLR